MLSFFISTIFLPSPAIVDEILNVITGGLLWMTLILDKRIVPCRSSAITILRWLLSSIAPLVQCGDIDDIVPSLFRSYFRMRFLPRALPFIVGWRAINFNRFSHFFSHNIFLYVFSNNTTTLLTGCQITLVIIMLEYIKIYLSE